MINKSNEKEKFIRECQKGDKTFCGLGMTHLYGQLTNEKLSQMPRDDFKLRGCRNMGLATFSVDDKHPTTLNHANANFCDFQVFKRALLNLGMSLSIPEFRFISFDMIELDFYFSPVKGSWRAGRWNEGLVTTLCNLSRIGIIVVGGRVFLPYFEEIKNYMELPHIRASVLKHFEVKLHIPGIIPESIHSPLWYAAILCETELRELNPPLYNANQERQFINGKCGWYVLTNTWKVTADEMRYELELAQRQNNGIGPNGRQTRHGSGDSYFVGLQKPETR